MAKITKLWGSAFQKDPKKESILFCAGRDVKELPPADEVLVPYEIKASCAWVKMLFSQKLIDKEILNKLLAGLKEIDQLWQKGKFKLDPAKEDVHTNIESYLIEKYGIDIGGKIHTGRSRNEQIIVDTILYLKDINELFIQELKILAKALNKAVKKYAGCIIPGYTHHQHATLTTFGQMLDAYKEIILKDIKKFASWNNLEEFNPLGSTAGYGTTLAIDKNKVNQLLGLNKAFSNEICAITFKGDAEIYMVYNICTMLNHLSSLAQTLILFNTKEFGFVKISDEYSTGSSIMPQKKNPDTLEVVKGKASVCQGYLMSLLGMTKGLFIGYNRDLQWIKYAIMDVISESLPVTSIMAGVVATLKVDSKKMLSVATAGFILCQPIMEGLIDDYKLPMRLAKIVVEETVKKSQKEGQVNLETLNTVLEKNKLKIIVSVKQFDLWTDPKNIVKQQMKKEEK